jgi:hypothetical protein
VVLQAQCTDYEDGNTLQFVCMSVYGQSQRYI